MYRVLKKQHLIAMTDADLQTIKTMMFACLVSKVSFCAERGGDETLHREFSLFISTFKEMCRIINGSDDEFDIHMGTIRSEIEAAQALALKRKEVVLKLFKTD